MKVLLLSPLPPPVGGIASWTQNILDYYKDTNFVNVVLLNTAIVGRNITRKDIFSRFVFGFYDASRVLLKLFISLKKDRPDVIHINSSGSLGLYRDYLVSLLAKYFNIPVVAHFHFGRIPDLRNLDNWEWKIFVKILDNLAHIILLDKNSFNTLNVLKNNNISVVANPISKQLECDIQKKIESNKLLNFSILFVGHITKSKGVYDLVKGYSLLDFDNDLVFVGPYEENVKNELIELAGVKANKIKFKGVMNKSDVLVEMQHSIALILPSHSEGFPNVIIEAMAMKCPIIATNVGAVADILNHGTSKPAGLVIEPKNVEAISAALDFMISNPEQAKKFADNAYWKVKNEYTLEKVCRQYEKVWTNCVNREI